MAQGESLGLLTVTPLGLKSLPFKPRNRNENHHSRKPRLSLKRATFEHVRHSLGCSMSFTVSIPFLL